MAEHVKRGGSAGQYNWVWMLLAITLVAAFLIWLTIASEPSEVAIVENENEEEVAGNEAATVELAEFAAQPERFELQRVHFPELNVQANVGPQAVWIELPTGIPYLVRFTERVQEAGVQARPGDRLEVTGTVRPMTDSVLNAWEQEGVLETEGQRLEAEFATSFVEATRVNVLPSQ